MYRFMQSPSVFFYAMPTNLRCSCLPIWCRKNHGAKLIWTVSSIVPVITAAP